MNNNSPGPDSDSDAQEKLKQTVNHLERLNEWSLNNGLPVDDKIKAFLDLISENTAAQYVTFTPNDAAHISECDGYTNSRCPPDITTTLIKSKLAFSEIQKTVNDPHILKRAFPHLQIDKLLAFPVYSSKKWLGVIRLYYLHSTAKSAQPRIISNELIKTSVDKFGTLIDLHLMVAELAKANDRFKRSQRCAHIGTWDWDIETGSLYWSELIAPLFGLEPGEIKTSYENFLAYVHPNDRAKVQNAVDRCIEQGAQYDIDHRIVWPDGSVHWVNEKGNVTRDENGKPLKMLGVVQDIQRIKDTEEQLTLARLEAEKASRAKSEFLSLMSHELRTPLNSILGFAQLLTKENLTDNQALYCEQIMSGGKILLELVNDILDLTRIESNQININIKDIDVISLINQCAALLKNQAQKNAITIKVLCPNNTPKVAGDFLRLKQVLINLLSNAIKYNKPNGLIEVDCERLNRNFLRIKIKDTGVGIPPEKRNEVFQPFSRLDHQNSKIEGVGIGLLITKKLIHNMQGDIDFESTPGEGTTFWIDLPLSKGNTANFQEEKAPQTTTCTSHKTILYIEDNPSNVELVKSIVTKDQRHQFVAATTGKTGIELAKKHVPDIVLLDLHLPDSDGLYVCQKLKNNKTTADIPVIAITADVARDSHQLTEDSFFADIIYKPFDLKEIELAIDRFAT